jgi:hypothetical protein
MTDWIYAAGHSRAPPAFQSFSVLLKRTPDSPALWPPPALFENILECRTVRQFVLTIPEYLNLPSFSSETGKTGNAFQPFCPGT